MEAVPKIPLLSFELKSSAENTQFGPKLKLYISEAYREDPDSYNNEIHQLEGLRSAAVRATSDAAGLSALSKYYCQLRAIQSRFPMGKGQPVACNFSWRDLHTGATSTVADIKYEMVCILYNIGALHTQLGASEPRTSPDSMKAACTNFQHAAYCFQQIKEQYTNLPGGDLTPEIMRVFQEICLAQAQECILEKSIQDTRKPSVIGAVAAQVLQFYKNAIAYLGPSAGSDTIHELIGTKLYNYWYRYMNFKWSFVACIVCLYQGMHAEEQQKMGERVAFYQQAVTRLNEARKLAKYVEPTQIAQEAITFTNDVVEGKRKAAKNENEFIYHEEVPDKDMLVDLKPVCLVKPLQMNFNSPDVAGPDIFSRLVPISAHEISSMYSEEKAKLLRRIVGMAESKNTELTEFMSSLQLDQLDVLESEQKIPQEIVDRCAAMNARTEIIQNLVESMNNLAEIISDVEHSLAEIKAMIQEETQKEKEYQKSIGPRPPSIVQTELSREYHKYQEAHTRTNESNQVLHKAMTLHIANLRLLALPLDMLQTKIPSIDNIEGLDRETMSEMRRVVNKAREMQTQRDSLIQQLREAVTADDVTAQLLARNNEPHEEIFKQEIQKHTPQVNIIEQNLSAQENIINKLTSLYASYGESRRLLSDVLRKRDGLINALITSYDAYPELLAKSQKGLEFYKKLSTNVNQLLARLRSTCQVQEEEREQMLAKNTKGSATAAAAKLPKVQNAPPAASTDRPGPKLKDYLPYMKNRAGARNVTPQAPTQVDVVPQDTYYPESIYPTSVRPAPLGSEATDLAQMQLPDGVVAPSIMRNPQNLQNPYNRYTTDVDSYSAGYSYPTTSKPYEKPEEYNYNYASNNIPQSLNYTNPSYTNQYPTDSGTIDGSSVTDSHNPYVSPLPQANINPLTSQYNTPQPQIYPTGQYGAYSDPYAIPGQVQPVQQIPEVMSSQSAYSHGNQTDLNVSFGQMQISGQKPEQTCNQDYSQSFYNMQYPQTSTPNLIYNSINPVPSVVSTAQNTTDYNMYYNQYDQQNVQVSTPYVASEPQYNYSTSSVYGDVTQSYPIYTNADTSMTYPTSFSSAPQTTSLPYNYLNEADKSIDPAVLANLDAIDKPIKSHVTGEALSTNLNYQGTNINYQNYDTTSVSYNTPEQENQPASSFAYNDQTNVNYVQNYQNHPGFGYNMATGNYDYNYGSQNSSSTYGSQVNVEPQSMAKDQTCSGPSVYTSAGNCETVQSPSENPQTPHIPADSSNQGVSSISTDNQTYYNMPYGYMTNINQSNEPVPDSPSVSTNYYANVNQSTYMQSGKAQNMSVTYINNAQVSTTAENLNESQNETANTQHVEHYTTEMKEIEPVATKTKTPPPEVTPAEVKSEEKLEPTTFDLLSDIDFSVEHKPLVPEIRVPQISESAIRKPEFIPKPEPKIKPEEKEEVIVRPPKKDIFSDPILLNKFTEEVKKLQKLVDTLTNKTASGLTVLDSKWKIFQDVQTKENATKSKTVASRHSKGNIVTDVVPYDDSRLKIKSNPNAYINASYYKQLASWCIPLVIAKNPSEKEYGTFWRAMLENNITCVVCLLSDIEMQGNAYWPTAIGTSLDLDGDLKVTLDEVSCTVNWTQRDLTVSCKKNVLKVAHYQISVFPSKIVCPPLVLLADKILCQTYSVSMLRGACIQCAAGAGRSAVLALLLLVLCQVRAGQPQLCDMLDEGCVHLYKRRTNVLEDTKFLADAYRTALFYVQGVICSGTVMFNGEAVSVPTGASVLPPITPTPATVTPSSANQRPQKFSKESFEEMRQSPGLKSGNMKDPLNFLDPLWSLKKK